MCEQCVADCKDHGEVVPKLWLVRASRDGHFMKKDQWGLVICNSPSVVFDTTPSVDETDNDTLVKFINELSEGEFSAGADIAYVCRDAGWNKEVDGSLISFLYDRIAKHLQKGK